MKNNFFLLAVLINFLGTTVHAKTVDEATARQVGWNYLNSIGVAHPADLITAYKAISIVNGTELICFYVFNTTPKGFVIISGDDDVEPVLGYSREASFNNDPKNKNLAYWLQGYRQQIAYALQNNATPSAEIKEKWENLKTGNRFRVAKVTSVGPLLTTKWNQSPYFNDLCPYDVLQHAHAVTGCVATAMAQVMKYWKWPSTGCGTHTYQDLLYGVQTVNFAAIKYQWNAMLDSLSGPDSAVAALMYSTGVSVDMQYGVDGSGAWVIPGDSVQTNITSYALKTYFHYKSSLTAVARGGNDLSDSFATAQWIQMLMTELNAGRPVIYTGFNHTEGHCWVCDGYENDSFFHFNWGWGGQDNGYFTLKTLLGLNQQQEAIFGIMPDSFQDYPGTIQLQSCLSSTSSPAKYGQPFSVSTKIVNTGAVQFNGDFCAQLFDSANNLQGTMQTITGQIINPGDSTGELTFGTNGMYCLAAGVYSIRILFRSSGANTWTTVANGNYINYSVMGIANDTDIMLYQPTQIITDTLVHGKPASINVYVADIGRSRFTGNLDLALYDVNTGVMAYDIGQLSDLYINPYDQHQYTFTDTSLMAPPGKYMLILKHQYTDTGSFCITGSAWEANPILVSVGGVTNFNSSDIYVYPNPAKNILYIDPYNNVLKEVRIINITGQLIKDIKEVRQESITSVSLENITPGLYFVQLFSNQNTVTKKIIVTH